MIMEVVNFEGKKYLCTVTTGTVIVQPINPKFGKTCVYEVLEGMKKSSWDFNTDRLAHTIAIAFNMI